MALTDANLYDFSLKCNLSVPAFQGTQSTILLESHPRFTNLSHVSVAQGTYTPTNDYLYILQNGLPSNQSPNFILVFCTGGQLNLSISTAQGNSMNSLPIFRSWSWLAPAVTTFIITGLYIEGRTNVLAPMAQGVPIDYYVVSGQGTIA